MNVKYLFASLGGDIPVVGEALDRPLHMNLSETHPALVLRDYFESIKELLLGDKARILIGVIAAGFGKKLAPNVMRSLQIRCEKVGTLYHIASITLQSEGDSFRLCVATATTKEAIHCLREEAFYLGFLTDTFHLTCLPKVFYRGEVICRTLKGDATLSHCVLEWFEDYHEWHLSLDESGRQRIILWDMERGYRSVSMEEGAEIHRQAARILTVCYDFHTGRQISPWSHGAGDFVVKMDDGGGFSVKLSTVRGYEPLLLRNGAWSFDPLVRTACFFLNLSLRMRLDRRDGTGPVLWAEGSILQPVASGFLDALATEEALHRYPLGEGEKIRDFLKSLKEDEIRRFLLSLLDHFSGEEKGVVEKHLEEHAVDLIRVLREYF